MRKPRTRSFPFLGGRLGWGLVSSKLNPFELHPNPPPAWGMELDRDSTQDFENT